MEHFPIAEYFYNGFWRLDFGFGNPNKTAVLLGQLILISFVFFKYGKFGKIFSILLSLFFSVCLVHTFSRGGILALSGGFFALLLCFAKDISARNTFVLLTNSFELNPTNFCRNAPW